ESQAKLYEGRLLKGAILVAVQCRNADQLAQAKNVMTETAAQDLSVSAEAMDNKREAAWLSIAHPQ
ncbi:MAG TPA: hypothetical protein VMI06_04725, partial [Terriglobia bacterium]|nr:hypothetical protein [Terriglobia bacterium]